MPATHEELTRVEAYIASVRWQFAKTMPDNPHWYTVRKWKPALEPEFIWFAELIRRVGYTEKWRDGRNYTYINVGQHRYWTMGAPIDVTIIINRELRADPADPAIALAEAGLAE